MRIPMVLIAVSLATACAEKAPPPEVKLPSLEAVATTKQVMLGITIPASDAVFAVAMKAPDNDADWEKLQNTALALAESGNLLMMGSRMVDQGDWVMHSRNMVERARAAAQAAAEKNADKVVEAGDAVYEVCDACHQKYMPARQGETPPQ